MELVPGVRVVQAGDFASEDPVYAGTITMAWELTPAEGGTRAEILAANVPDGISTEDHAAGLASSLANLADCLQPGAGHRADDPTTTS
ncbi:SRPBCC domain-containing protein [Kocuria flava]|uniref:SRPBCC domain-containing protein n=1 Tax=Kocuria flava TaxID=446860 RepID=UPI002150F2DE|nr:SRPBCC domain-containing protein [Kocuria flava]